MKECSALFLSLQVKPGEASCCQNSYEEAQPHSPLALQTRLKLTRILAFPYALDLILTLTLTLTQP